MKINLVKVPKNLQKLVISVANKTSEMLSLPKDIEATVFFADKKKIQMLNNDTRQIDKPTDVLSFPNIEFESFSNITKENYPYDVTDDNNIYLGDVAVCPEEVEGFGQQKETLNLAIIVAHGLLHLLGYDHADKTSEKEMFELQEKIAKDINEK